MNKIYIYIYIYILKLNQKKKRYLNNRTKTTLNHIANALHVKLRLFFYKNSIINYTKIYLKNNKNHI